jgi:hypothetical protein
VKGKPKIVFEAQSAGLRKRGLLMTNEQISDKIKAEVAEEHEKLLALCVYYKIPQSDYMFYQLSLSLARELFPKPKRAGRKSKWTNLNQGALVVEIERLVEAGNSNRSVSWAAKQLAMRAPWKSFIESRDTKDLSNDPAEVLRTTYQRFKNNGWANMLRDAFKWCELQKEIDKWDAQVIDFVNNPHPD